jgi:type II secretory pathway pseudopilin PulG
MNTSKSSSFKAFALLEIAIALCVFGIINYASFAVFNKIKAWQQIKTTKSHQEQVMQAIASYVLTHKKLPCPATTDNGNAKSFCTTAESAVGYIPYKTLSIPEELAKDGNHHWMSYAINTALTSAWILDLDTSTLDASIAPSQTFCGINSTDTLTIKDSNNNNCITDPDFAAAVIISHGKSGDYYIDNGIIQPCNSNDFEKITNINRKGIYFTKPLHLKDNAIFDDHLLFVSRNNLMAIWAQTPCKRQ